MTYRIALGTIITGVTLAGCERADVETVSSSAACDIDYVAIKATELIEIESGLSVYKRFVLDELSEDDLSEKETQLLDRMQVILDNRERPVDRQDLTILDNARLRLSDSSVWDRADDRNCEPTDKTFSLFCALYFGSVDAVGEYQHRRTAMQEIRFAIEDATSGREFDHRMKDFNNLPETSFGDIQGVIKTARERVRIRLDLQSDCAL